MYGNDYEYEYIFSKTMESLIGKGDFVAAISSSEKSPNIINAIGIAKSKKATVITFTGFKSDNKAKQIGDTTHKKQTKMTSFYFALKSV
ncbi:MAG: hypothetical protein NC407_09790 [Lachnoclostridium sp.]|nr:hypothetical protein [Lachnoclostridium sp.]